MSNKSALTEPRHTIGVVSRRTGLNQLLLRAWERRHNVVDPGRTKTGRRLYSDRDLERLTLLRILTENGYRIGDVATLPIKELRSAAGEITVISGRVADPVPRGKTVGPEQLLEDCLLAIEKMDSHGLEKVLDRASVDLSRPVLRRSLMQPLLVEIGERWHQGAFRVAQEHMASSIINTFLASLNARQTVPAGSPLLTVATPSGNLHEMGAMMAAAHALEVGWDVLYLGPNLPAEDVVAGAQARQAKAIFLSLVYPSNDPSIAEELLRLRRLQGEGFPIIVSGRACVSYQDTIGRIGAIWAPDPGAFDLALNSIFSA